MKKHRETQRNVIPTKTLKRMLWIAGIIWFIILCIAIIMYSLSKSLNLIIVLGMIFLAALVSIPISFFTIASIAILFKWEI